MERPDSARGFGTLMSTWGEGSSLIQDVYPVDERLIVGFDVSSKPEQVMWVDVGGGYGQKTIALKRACPTMERTEAQWRQLLLDAGLRVVGIHSATDGVSEGLIEAETIE